MRSCEYDFFLEPIPKNTTFICDHEKSMTMVEDQKKVTMTTNIRSNEFQTCHSCHNQQKPIVVVNSKKTIDIMNSYVNSRMSM